MGGLKMGTVIHKQTCAFPKQMKKKEKRKGKQGLNWKYMHMWVVITKKSMKRQFWCEGRILRTTQRILFSQSTTTGLNEPVPMVLWPPSSIITVSSSTAGQRPLRCPTSCYWLAMLYSVLCLWIFIIPTLRRVERTPLLLVLSLGRDTVLPW